MSETQKTVIKISVDDLRKIADRLENYSGLSDFGPARKDLLEEAVQLNALADILETLIK